MTVGTTGVSHSPPRRRRKVAGRPRPSRKSGADGTAANSSASSCGMALRTHASNAAIRRAFSCRAATISTTVSEIAPKAAIASTAHAGIAGAATAGDAIGIDPSSKVAVAEFMARGSWRAL